MKSKIDLITGFLGTGKTTFIHRYTDYLKKKKIRYIVIENEFGSAGVDTQLIERENQDAEVQELSGGCICCSLKIQFAQVLTECADKYERIIIEPSGIFSPRDFFEVVNSPVLQAKCEIGMVLAVIDPGTFTELPQNAMEVFVDQLYSAGGILVSKMEKKDDGKTESVLLAVQEIMNHATGDDEWSKQHAERYFAQPWDAITEEDFERLSSWMPFSTEGFGDKVNHGAVFSCAAFYPKRRYTQKEIEAMVESLRDTALCGRVFRIKGRVLMQNGGGILINCTPSETQMEPISGECEPVLNVIGYRLSRKKIARYL